MLYQLIQEQPNLLVRIISGQRAGLVERVLQDPALAEGTLLHY